MLRAQFKIGVIVLSAFLLTLAISCSKQTDDTRLDPEQRADRFDKFVEEGMDWKTLVKAFKPTKYQITVPSAGGGGLDEMFRSGREKKTFDEAQFARDLAAAPNYDTFYFEYVWQTRPLVFHDVAFGKDGKIRNYSRNGSFH